MAHDTIVEQHPDAAALPSAPTSLVGRVSDYLELCKPRLNLLVVITTAVGFYMGAGPNVVWMLLLHVIIGTALTAAGASALNQLIERRHDGLMPRTRTRPLPAGRVQPIEALILGVTLGLGGVAYLSTFVNPLTAGLGALTMLSYLFVYTPSKRMTTLNTVIGAIPGAIPPMMGVTAAQDAITPAAIVLFAILFVWQMPHFLAIAVLYHEDYSAGGFKMLPSRDPAFRTTRSMIVQYGLALIPVSLLPCAITLCGPIYCIAAVILGLGFLAFGIRCARHCGRSEARALFFASIIYLPLLLTALMLDKLPGT